METCDWSKNFQRFKVNNVCELRPPARSPTSSCCFQRNPTFNLFISLSINPSIPTSVRPYVHLSIRTFGHRSTHSPIDPSICQPMHLVIHPSVNPFIIYRSNHLSTRPCIYGSISKQPFIHSWVNRINMSSCLTSPFPTSSCLLASPWLYPYLKFAAFF